MAELPKNENDRLQLWVDKLAELNSGTVTQNDITAWAASIPIRPIKDINPVPLFLYGDATIDKAIVSLIQGDPVEPNAASIYGALKNNFSIADFDGAVGDVSVVDMNVVSPLTQDNKATPFRGARKGFEPATYDLEQQQEDINIENLKLKSKTNRDVSSSLKSNVGRQADRKTFSFSTLTKDSFKNNERLSLLGFEVCPYDNNHFMISNGPLDYIINNDNLNSGIITVEDEEGKTMDYESMEDFVAAVEADSTSNFSKTGNDAIQMNKKLKKANFANEQGQYSLAFLAHVMHLFANDLLFMHHYAAGDNFDSVHNITEDLYNEALEHVDTLAEMALRGNETVGNFAKSCDYVSPEVYSCMETGAFTKEEMKKALAEKGGALLETLRNLRPGYDQDIVSKLDEIVNYWAKEVEYKNASRMKFSNYNFSNDDDHNSGSKDKKKDTFKDVPLSDAGIKKVDSLISELQITRKNLMSKNNLTEADRRHDSTHKDLYNDEISYIDSTIKDLKKTQTLNDFKKLAYKEKLKQRAVEEFKGAVTDSLVDIAVEEAPGYDSIELYDRVLGNKIIQDHPHLDDALYSLAKGAGKYKYQIGNIAKAGLRILTPMMFNSQSDLLNNVAKNLRKMNFSEEQITSVLNGQMFAGFPRDSLNVLNLTREATIRLLGSPYKAEKLLFAYGLKNIEGQKELIERGKKYFEGEKKNFANEEFSTIEAFDLPARLAFHIVNPRTSNYTDPILSKEGAANGDEKI